MADSVGALAEETILLSAFGISVSLLLIGGEKHFVGIGSVGYSCASVVKIGERFENIFWKEKLFLQKLTSQDKYILKDFQIKALMIM